MDEDRIRKRAQSLWEQEGQPEGQAMRHWQQAETDLRAEEIDNGGQSAVEGIRTAEDSNIVDAVVGEPRITEARTVSELSQGERDAVAAANEDADDLAQAAAEREQSEGQPS